jgi:very-short-patch-repair endonuclease
MARSEKNWAAFFNRTDKKKKVKKKWKSASVPSTVREVEVPRVKKGKLIFVHSYRPIRVRKSHILTNAEERRADPTPAETRLEKVLNSLNDGALRGKFKREHVVSGKWIVDFFFPEIRLAIEVDGSVHDTPVQRAKDLKKDSDCKRFDITVLRIRNAEIFADREVLIQKIRAGWREALDRENRIIGTPA